ncbi:DUF2922 family protein [Desulfosporosinus sp.]|uniref:DUF2922 family protein n=1 Tax=Desulfosporosinus sp. TaxID=157907 RepID=UPI0034476767
MYQESYARKSLGTSPAGYPCPLSVLSTTKVVRLTFSTAGGKTFAITTDNPKKDLQGAEAMATSFSNLTNQINQFSGLSSVSFFEELLF